MKTPQIPAPWSPHGAKNDDKLTTIEIPGIPEKRHRIPAPPDAAGAVGDYRQIEDRREGRTPVEGGE